MVRSEISPLSVKSKADLERYLGQSLLPEYYDRSEGQFRQTSTSLKTYLLELHAEGVEDFAERSPFSSVRETDTAGLWLAFDADEIAYFVDASTPRFCFVHTIGHTNRTDALWKRIPTSDLKADYCWFSSRFLEQNRLGSIIGFRLFSQQQLRGLAISDEARELAEDLGKDAPPAFRTSISDWASAEEDLEAFRTETSLGRRAALRSINWRQRTVDDSGNSKFIHDEVWSTGKVTAYGTSWATHLANINMLRRNYSEFVAALEEDYQMRWSARTGLSGTPISITFEGPSVESLEQFAEDVASGKEPFRILGQVDTTHEGFVAIDGIDIHSRDRLHLELSRGGVRLYLRKGTCGNVVPRFLVNFEHYYSSTLQTSVDQRLGAS